MSKYTDFILNLVLIVAGVWTIIEGEIPTGLVFIAISVFGVDKLSTTYKKLKR